MSWKKTIQFATLMLLTVVASAQDESVGQTAEPNPCFAVEDLEQMLHLTFRDVYDILDAKGYQMGFFSDKANGEQNDTIDGVVLTYSRMAFNDIRDRKSAVWLYTSKDGLCNVVEWERNLPGNCSLFQPFHQKGYVYDRSSGIFHGSGLYNGEVEHYEVQYYEDSTILHLTIKNIREIDSFVTKRREAMEDSLLAQVDEARVMALTYRYLPAIELLNSLEGNGPRVDSAVASMYNYVVEQAETYYFTKLNAVVNNNGDMASGVLCCDTLLMFTTAQDSVREIRTLLQGQLNGEVKLYSVLRPTEYQQIVNSLEKILNDELKQNALSEEQRLTMNFTFQTSYKNFSSGNISVGLADRPFKTQSEPTSIRSRMLQQKINELAQSNLIQPVHMYGVYLTTRESLSADVRWRSYTLQVQDECNATNQQLASAVKYIDDHYFSTYDTVRLSLSQQGEDVKVLGRVRKPTKRDYTFSINEKRMGSIYHNDITLTKFKTTGLLSWTPSLIIPGLGTKNQGLHSSVAARAIPFFLCAALSVTGFMWENNGGKQVARPTFEEGGAAMPWHYKDVGYYLGYGAGSIAAAIYVNELVEGIVCSIKNQHRSKSLRKKLKKGPIVVQTEDVRLQ